MSDKSDQIKCEKWARIVAKAWSDPNFEKKLMANPVQTLREENIETPANAKIHVLKNTENELNLVIPHKPKGELSEEALRKIAVGAGVTLLGIK